MLTKFSGHVDPPQDACSRLLGGELREGVCELPKTSTFRQLRHQTTIT